MQPNRHLTDRYYTPHDIAKFMLREVYNRGLVHKGDVIMDPCCGHGVLFEAAHYFISQPNDYKFVGYDINEEAITYCQERFKGDFKLQDLSITFQTKYDDNVFCLTNQPFTQEWHFKFLEEATKQFTHGMVYCPLRAALAVPCKIIKEYLTDELTPLFECDIKYDQGVIIW